MSTTEQTVDQDALRRDVGDLLGALQGRLDETVRPGARRGTGARSVLARAVIESGGFYASEESAAMGIDRLRRGDRVTDAGARAIRQAIETSRQRLDEPSEDGGEALPPVKTASSLERRVEALEQSLGSEQRVEEVEGQIAKLRRRVDRIRTETRRAAAPPDEKDARERYAAALLDRIERTDGEVPESWLERLDILLGVGR